MLEVVIVDVLGSAQVLGGRKLLHQEDIAGEVDIEVCSVRFHSNFLCLHEIIFGRIGPCKRYLAWGKLHLLVATLVVFGGNGLRFATSADDSRVLGLAWYA